jgi:hypothetical protein
MEEVSPHKLRYYLEQRDPKFAEKMAEVLRILSQGEAPEEGRGGVEEEGAMP